MELTNGEIFQTSKALEELSKEKLPLKTSYQVAMLIKKLSDQLSVINKMRLNVIEKYGDKTPENKFTILPSSQNWNKFIEEMNELFMQKIDVDFEKIELPECVDEKEFIIEPTKLLLLEKFIQIHTE